MMRLPTTSKTKYLGLFVRRTNPRADFARLIIRMTSSSGYMRSKIITSPFGLRVFAYAQVAQSTDNFNIPPEVSGLAKASTANRPLPQIDIPSALGRTTTK